MGWRVPLALVLLAAGCQRAEVADPPETPELTLLFPGEGHRVPFDEPLLVRATATAPPGGRIIGVDLVLRGALDERRRIAAEGETTEIAVEIVVGGEGHLGPDLIPLELVLAPEANVGGRVRTGAPRGTRVTVVDRTEPELSIRFSPGIAPPPGFDAAFAAGTAFTLSVTASDPVGGIARILVDAPALLGGPRERRLPAAHEASLDLVFLPPADADLTVVVVAEDAADTANRTERTLRIRIGAGGVDETAPELALVEDGALECGVPARFEVLAVDESSGVEHVTVRGPGFEATAFGPSTVDPQALSVVAIGVPEGPAGQPIAFEAEAQDTFGNVASASFARDVVDTRPPELVRVAQLGAFAPGRALELEVFGGEACGVIDRLQVDFGSATATAAIGVAGIAGPVTISTPEEICVLETATATVVLLDLEGLESRGATLALDGEDLVPPRIRINTLVPAGGLGPGDTLAAQIGIEDGQTAVRTATVTLSSVGLPLVQPIRLETREWPATGCADRVPREIPLSYAIPDDLQATTSSAALRIWVEATDAAGNAASAMTEIPFIE